MISNPSNPNKIERPGNGWRFLNHDELDSLLGGRYPRYKCTGFVECWQCRWETSDVMHLASRAVTYRTKLTPSQLIEFKRTHVVT